MGSFGLKPRTVLWSEPKTEQLRASAQVQELFQFEHCIFAGRGRSALALAMMAGGLPIGSPVILPANICPSVIAAVLFAKMRPLILPVRLDTGLPDESDALRLLEDTKVRGFLLIAHLYGIHCAQYRLVEEARRRNWIIIESDTLAATAYTQNTRLESDAMILSFGSGKSIQAGSGGALLIHDSAYAGAAQSVIADWNPISDIDNALEDHLMAHRRALRARHQPHLYSRSLAQELALIPRSASIDWERLNQALFELPSNRTRALESWERWSCLLRDKPLALTPKPDFPWRLIAIAENVVMRDALLSTLRHKRIDAGSNYPSIANFFPQFAQNQISTRDYFGDRALNLWLTDSYGEKASEIVAICTGMR